MSWLQSYISPAQNTVDKSHSLHSRNAFNWQQCYIRSPAQQNLHLNKPRNVHRTNTISWWQRYVWSTAKPSTGLLFSIRSTRLTAMLCLQRNKIFNKSHRLHVNFLPSSRSRQTAQLLMQFTRRCRKHRHAGRCSLNPQVPFASPTRETRRASTWRTGKHTALLVVRRTHKRGTRTFHSTPLWPRGLVCPTGARDEEAWTSEHSASKQR